MEIDTCSSKFSQFCEENFSSIHVRGMTLVEVMVAIVLSSILALSLSGTWAMVSNEFFRLTLRQKAIFVLNGEMERLVAAFRYKNSDTSSATNWLIQDSTGSSFYIYNSLTTDANIRNIVTTIAMNDPSFADSNISTYNNASQEYNVLWLDRDREITATLKWDISETVGLINDSITNNDCFWTNGNGPNDSAINPNHCRLLKVYLKYPFRYQTTNPISETMGPTDEISLQTIVGGLK
ncbi:conserved hypothetical protein [Gammaproteobacteria bacterium]